MRERQSGSEKTPVAMSPPMVKWVMAIGAGSVGRGSAERSYESAAYRLTHTPSGSTPSRA